MKIFASQRRGIIYTYLKGHDLLLTPGKFRIIYKIILLKSNGGHGVNNPGEQFSRVLIDKELEYSDWNFLDQ